MAADRPNVLLICTDQHRYDVLSSYGNDSVMTPNIARLADQGVVFEHCYTTNTVCAPARASMMTGMYPSAHRLWANGVRLPDDEMMASKALNKAGYRTGLVGKLHLSACFPDRTEQFGDHGFDVLDWAHDPRHGSPENAYHAWLREHFPQFHRGAGHGRGTPPDEDRQQAPNFDQAPTPAHYSTWATERAIDFLDNQPDDQPFFLWVNYFDPHHAFEAPEEWLDRYPAGSVPPPVGGMDELAGKPSVQAEAARSSYAGYARGFADYTAEEVDEARRTYYAMVTLIDDRVGALLGRLDELGMADNTLVIFTSDHGEMLGDHGLMLKGPMMYDPAVRVPLIVRWPGVLPSGARQDGMAGLHDIAPTLLSAAGVDALPGNQGTDLREVATGRTPGRTWAMTEYRNSGHPYDPPVHTTMFRTHTHKLVVWHGQVASGRTREGELYDLRADPDELENLWDDPASQSIKTELLLGLADATVAAEDRRPERAEVW